MESVRACQLAAIMSVDTPTVVHVVSPSLLSISTRTVEAVASRPDKTRTL